MRRSHHFPIRSGAKTRVIEGWRRSREKIVFETAEDSSGAVKDGRCMAQCVASTGQGYRDSQFDQDVWYARDLMRDRKVNPRDPEEDPASSLLLEKDANGEPLSEEHLVGCLRQSLVVGVVAPPILIGSILVHLARDKALQQQLRASLSPSSTGTDAVMEDPAILPAAIEEFLRLYTPYRGFARTVSQPTDLHGRTIRPGEPITLHYSSANRDPDIFGDDADKFRLGRENIKAHLGFGRGRHRCAGEALARMALAVVLETVLRQTKDFDIVDEVTIEYARMPEMGVISCHMKFVKA